MAHLFSCFFQESQWGTDYVEVIGQIESDYTLREFKTSNLGNSFGKFCRLCA